MVSTGSETVSGGLMDENTNFWSEKGGGNRAFVRGSESRVEDINEVVELPCGYLCV